MMNKLIVLVLALAIAAPALADDLIAPSWRGDPGSTYSEWTYDDPCGVFDWDFPEVSSFVPRAGWGDPTFPYDPCEPFFSGQVWGWGPGGSPDPCTPWYDGITPELPGGRTGALSFEGGSWDIGNFIDEAPFKDLWVQITYLTVSGDPTVPDYIGAGAGGDPEAPATMGEYEGPASEWPEGMEIMWTWEEEPDVWWNWMEAPLDEWDPAWPDPTGEWGEELWFDAVLESSTILGDGWIHDVYSIAFEPNPDSEWFEFELTEAILIDQIIIETISYVPEPATMVLLGLGSLMMIRRKKRQGS